MLEEQLYVCHMKPPGADWLQTVPVLAAASGRLLLGLLPLLDQTLKTHTPPFIPHSPRLVKSGPTSLKTTKKKFPRKCFESPEVEHGGE